MNPAIVHMSSSVATLRFGFCAEGSVAVYPELAKGVSPEPVEDVTLSLSKVFTLSLSKVFTQSLSKVFTLSLSKGTLVPGVYTQMCEVQIFKFHK